MRGRGKEGGREERKKRKVYMHVYMYMYERKGKQEIKLNSRVSMERGTITHVHVYSFVCMAITLCKFTYHSYFLTDNLT